VVECVPNARINAGYVMSQNPAAGPVPFGSTVTLTVSLGQERTVPNCVEMTEDEANKALKDAGFNGHTIKQNNDAVGQGIVFKQEPAAGTPAGAIDTVTLYVSSGPARITLPNLVGMTAEQAQEILQNKHFGVKDFIEQFSDKRRGIVIAQDPPAGAEVAFESDVVLTVSKGKENEEPYGSGRTGSAKPIKG
jgi:eukaryotic-like serine/threonine-protein kinase